MPPSPETPPLLSRRPRGGHLLHTTSQSQHRRWRRRRCNDAGLEDKIHSKRGRRRRHTAHPRNSTTRRTTRSTSTKHRQLPNVARHHTGEGKKQRRPYSSLAAPPPPHHRLPETHTSTPYIHTGNKDPGFPLPPTARAAGGGKENPQIHRWLRGGRRPPPRSPFYHCRVEREKMLRSSSH